MDRKKGGKAWALPPFSSTPVNTLRGECLRLIPKSEGMPSGERSSVRLLLFHAPLSPGLNELVIVNGNAFRFLIDFGLG